MRAPTCDRAKITLELLTEGSGEGPQAQTAGFRQRARLMIVSHEVAPPQLRGAANPGGTANAIAPVCPLALECQGSVARTLFTR